MAVPVARRGAMGGWLALLKAEAKAPLPEAVYRDFIAQLFTMTVPILGLGVLTVVIGAMLGMALRDPVMGGLALAGGLLTVVRVAVLRAYRATPQIRMTLAQLQAWEARYAWGNYAFALLLAAINVRALGVHAPIAHMVSVSLIFTFGAGMVSRISGRPTICIGSLLIATVPTVAAMAVHASWDDPTELHAGLFVMEAVLLAVVMLMSIASVRHLYEAGVEHLTARHDLAFLARQDALTGLPNRLLLRERFQSGLEAAAGGAQMAVHFLDLDGFKGVNDRFGHPMGDALLREVSERLRSTVRTGDTVARLGGDEFVIVQNGVRHEGEAEMLARRVIRQLSAPYEIGGETMTISVSVGIALSPQDGTDLDRLSACADEALYRSKIRGKAQFHFYAQDEAPPPVPMTA